MNALFQTDHSHPPSCGWSYYSSALDLSFSFSSHPLRAHPLYDLARLPRQHRKTCGHTQTFPSRLTQLPRSWFQPYLLLQKLLLVVMEIVDDTAVPADRRNQCCAFLQWGSKYILVDISEQHMYVYEGDALIYSFVASTGIEQCHAHRHVRRAEQNTQCLWLHLGYLDAELAGHLLVSRAGKWHSCSAHSAKRRHALGRLSGQARFLWMCGAWHV